jgi:HlyD family secretion protein
MLETVVKIKVGQQVTVKIDTENEMKSYPEQFLGLSSGRIYTKKISKRKEERVNLVYAVKKISVKNDGGLK